VRTLVLLLAGAAIAFGAWLLAGSPFSGPPVTKAEIEHEVRMLPRGRVQTVFCNQVAVPTRDPQPDAPDTWTCDTYVGATRADAQNGPSYRVLVSGDRIASIRRVPTH